MIELTLQGAAERLAPPDEQIGGRRLLLHQALTRQATAPIVMNTYPTGTGKTLAALLRLRHRAQQEHTPPNCLFIAPTNELLAQHVETVRQFMAQHLPNYRVIGIDRETRDALALPENLVRGGAKLHEILRNPWLVTGEERKHPFIFVVNPDIFYAAFYFRYGRLDQRNLFRDFLLLFDQVVIDEFHYYNPKQVANFLFFFRVCRGYGYFEGNQRQIILLSATPGPYLNKYLDRLGVDIQKIEPSATGPGGDAVAALASVHLEVYSTDEIEDGLPQLVTQRRAQITSWVDNGQQGAIISGALWRINHCYNLMQPVLGHRVLRLTGAETRAGREAARAADLILATPTVDIGYNFERADKARQSLDFLLFDARSSDDVVQRLGRAGRVLGKREVDQPSQVIALVPPELHRAIAAHAGQMLDRQAFAQLVMEALPAKHNVDAYISRGAILEAMLPLYKLGTMGSRAERKEVEELFEAVRSLYAPHSKRTFSCLEREIRQFEKLEQRFGGKQDRKDVPLDYVAAAITEQLRKAGKTINAKDVEATYAQGAWRSYEGVREHQENWARDRAAYAVQRARFSFREAFEAPQALVYDPGHLLSGADVVRYDALHVVANVVVDPFSTWAVWATATGQREVIEPVALYCVAKELRAARDRLRLSLLLNVEESRGEWDPTHCGIETALRGLQLTAGGAALSREMRLALAEQDVAAYLLPAEHRAIGKLHGLCRTEGYRLYDLEVSFAEGSHHSYVVLLGTAALLAGAALFPILQATKGWDGTIGGAIIC